MQSSVAQDCQPIILNFLQTDVSMITVFAFLNLNYVIIVVCPADKSKFLQTTSSFEIEQFRVEQVFFTTARVASLNLTSFNGFSNKQDSIQASPYPYDKNSLIPRSPIYNPLK